MARSSTFSHSGPPKKPVFRQVMSVGKGNGPVVKRGGGGGGGEGMKNAEAMVNGIPRPKRKSVLGGLATMNNGGGKKDPVRRNTQGRKRKRFAKMSVDTG